MPPKPAPLKPLERSIFGRLAQFLVRLWGRLQRAWFRWAELNQHSPWFPFFIAAIVAIDAIVVVLPGDVVVALAVLSNPSAWKRLAVWAGLGSALGALLVFITLSHFGREALDHLAALGAPTATMEQLGDLNAEQADLEAGFAALSDPQPVWQRARNFFQHYGLFSLAFTSVLPLLSWPTVLVAGLSSDRWLEAFLWLLVGRQARYWIGCFGVREGWAMFQTLREEAQSQRRSALASTRRRRRSLP